MTSRTQSRHWLAGLLRWLDRQARAIQEDEYAPGVALTLDEYRRTHPVSPPARGEAMRSSDARAGAVGINRERSTASTTDVI